MADDSTTNDADGATPKASDNGQSRDGDGDANGKPGANADGKTPGSDDTTASLVADLRRENATRRNNEKSLQTAKVTLESEKSVWEQKYNAAVDEIRSFRIDAAVASALSDVRAVNPKTLARLIDRGKVEWDDKGAIKSDSITAQIATLRKESPELFVAGAGRVDAGASSVGKPASDMNAAIRRAAGR